MGYEYQSGERIAKRLAAAMGLFVTTPYPEQLTNFNPFTGDKLTVDDIPKYMESGRIVTLPPGMTIESPNSDLMPAFLAHPVAIETEVEILLRSAALPDDNKSSGVYNPWGGKLTPISDPRLDANSETAWYLIADPSQIDTIEVAYLDGNEMPYTEEQTLFERDAVGYKIRHDIGVGAMDYRGFYKNPGA